MTQVQAPAGSSGKTKKGGKTNSNAKTDWAERDEKNRSLGLAGELLVLAHEKQKLEELGRKDVAEQVSHVAAGSDGDGYDILSYDEHGIEMYIEVKTTKKGRDASFFISRNEVEVSRDKGSQYWIYRVFGLKDSSTNASFYSLQGPVDNHFDLRPESYKPSLKT